MNFPDINVHGILVKQETQVAALKLFLQNQSRRALSLECFLEDLGVPAWNGTTKKGSSPQIVSNRVADRILQRARKANIISFSNGRWIDDVNAPAFLAAASS